MNDPAVGCAYVSVLPGPIAAAILGRVASTLAARAGLSGGRTADLVRVTDAIAGSDAVRAARMAQVRFAARAGELSLTVGPLPTDGADKLLHAPADAPLDICHLSDARAVRDGDESTLSLSMRD